MAEPTFYSELLHDFPVVVVQPVVWGDMDAYGHVNNTVYFRYFENARLEYFIRLGWPAVEDATGVGPILRDTSARFRLALTYPDIIAIGARAVKLETDRFFLEHKIVSQQRGAVVTEGTGTVVAYHHGDGQKMPLPAAVAEAIRRLEGGTLP
jgi:acyl-CoA thioester hydrolase